MGLEQLIAERASCYHLARQINEKRVILSRALRTQEPFTSFHEILRADFYELTQQLRRVLDRSRRLTLQITLERQTAGES
ncbi:hypothetical protein [Anthocerotibacter panamensis]|uniref:hypothetical protein n=1 Tax=Anthocerotibacter panamensis TaxID=2857077 RepID=UPI001C405D0E|nr:hypothetical protein [Anthocerotibacter panamensis]